MSADILKYLPPFLQVVTEFMEIAESENPEFDTLKSYKADVLNDQFLADATENGISRWETILGITPKGTDTLDDRRFRVLANLNKNLPYTYTTLVQQLINLCGENGYTVSVDNANYLVTVKIALSSKSMYDEVNKLLVKMIPANMLIDLDLLYNTWAKVKSYTWGHFKTTTWRDLKDEVIS
ncbi:MAG: YmfQ family protein [Clostridia bacterium]|nr:YmfQ family protein [Clostridia bacterium]